MFSEDLSRTEELVRVKYSANDIADILKSKRQKALENQIYEKGKEEAYADAIALLMEYITDWRGKND